MKTKILLLIIICASVYNTSCKKDVRDEEGYIQLYNKPLSKIRSTLNGKWQVHKIQGGIGLSIEYPKNTFIEFKFGGSVSKDSIKSYNDTMLIINERVTMSKEYLPLFPSSTPVCLIKYPVGGELIVYGIKNDTLLLSDTFIDGFGYYCTKVK